MRAKFKCSSVEKFEFGERPKLNAVYGNGEENKDFAKATPWGILELQIDNPDALGFFEPGGEYYLDISEAPKS